MAIQAIQDANLHMAGTEGLGVWALKDNLSSEGCSRKPAVEALKTKQKQQNSPLFGVFRPPPTLSGVVVSG